MNQNNQLIEQTEYEYEFEILIYLKKLVNFECELFKKNFEIKKIIFYVEMI